MNNAMSQVSELVCSYCGGAGGNNENARNEPMTTLSHETKRILDAFADGWADGAAGTACATMREVATRFPAYDSLEAEVYLNGAEDGARGDRFRLDMRPDMGE